MDKLDQIFAMQSMLDAHIIERRGLAHITPEEWVQKDVLAIISELGELLDEVNFKWWKNPKALDKAALHEELIDVLHFFVSMCIHAGMGAEDVYWVYMDKNKENFNRQQGISQKPGYAPQAPDTPIKGE